jgi:hypothetical protein
MSHDYEGAAWADHHKDVSNGLARLLKMLAQVFDRLAAIEYDAPWERVRC